MNKDKQQLYTSPALEVMETQMQTVICQSTTPMPVDEPFNF